MIRLLSIYFAVYVYPYLLGFSAQEIEIFTLLNGSLVKVCLDWLQLFS